MRSLCSGSPGLVLVALFTIFISSCGQPAQEPDVAITKQLRLADSLASTSKGDSALSHVKRLRPQIKNNDPVLVDYYCLITQWETNLTLNSLYADSALAFFSTQKLKERFPNQYYKALLCRGEASVHLKQYNSALRFYYQARQVLNNGNCEDGYLSVKMAGIYYNQKNYKMAAKLWSGSYHLILQCDGKYSFQKQFYTLQSVLNSAGVSYQKIGKLDSARYYYHKDVELIARAKAKGVNVSSASTVVFDNLGGLNLLQHHIDTARMYLLQSINMPQEERDGIKIPPYLKLADLYTQTGEYDKARDAFVQSRQRLERFPQNLDLEVLWNKLYAKFLFMQGQGAQAYQYQDQYMRLKDSLDNVTINLYRLDVRRELNSIGQQKTVTQLEQKNKSKKIYLAGSIIIVLLAFAIIFLVYRNLKRSRSLHQNTILQNQQLEQAMAELERANQNYIRVMRVMAHDLRNPISGMTGLAAVLLGEDDLSADKRHMLQLIESTGINTMEMISELLRSGLADENEAMQVELVDLKNLLFDSVELLQFKANEKRQRIVFESDAIPVMGRVNHEKMWRVFNNLIVNAIKFSHEDTIIKVGVAHEGKHILFFVADNGIGIPDEDKDSVFEMFTPAKREGTGGEQPFGLGLSISKRIIEKHNGRIWFSSEPNSGTTFYIELPCVE